MSIDLKKGSVIDLSKASSSPLKHVVAGLGWDPVKKKGFFNKIFDLPDTTPDIDIDASAFLLSSGRFFSSADIVFFKNLTHYTGAVKHMGDNLTGEGEDDSDDEQIYVDLLSIPENYTKIVFCANIYNAATRNQHFGMIENAYMRLLDHDTGKELCRYNLTEYSGKTAIILGEIFRYGEDWKFKAIGNGVNASFIGELTQYIS